MKIYFSKKWSKVWSGRVGVGRRRNVAFQAASNRHLRVVPEILIPTRLCLGCDMGGAVVYPDPTFNDF